MASSGLLACGKCLIQKLSCTQFNYHTRKPTERKKRLDTQNLDWSHRNIRKLLISLSFFVLIHHFLPRSVSSLLLIDFIQIKTAPYWSWSTGCTMGTFNEAFVFCYGAGCWLWSICRGLYGVNSGHKLQGWQAPHNAVHMNSSTEQDLSCAEKTNNIRMRLFLFELHTDCLHLKLRPFK